MLVRQKTTTKQLTKTIKTLSRPVSSMLPLCYSLEENKTINAKLQAAVTNYKDSHLLGIVDMLDSVKLKRIHIYLIHLSVADCTSNGRLLRFNTYTFET